MNDRNKKSTRTKIVAALVERFIEEVNIPPRPWVVLGEPSVDQLEKAFSEFPEFDDMISEGVLISTRVHQSDNDPTNVTGFVNNIQIEGIGGTPEEAVVNTLSGVEFDTLESMQRQAEVAFDPFWDFLGVGVRHPNKEKGIFLKVDDTGRVVVLDEYRNIDMQTVRNAAYEWQRKIIEMQKTVSIGYVDEIIQRQRTVETALDQYESALRRDGRLATATAAAELAREAASSLREADEARTKAAKYSKILNGISIAQSIIGVASAVNSEIERQAQQKALESISNQLKSSEARLGYLENSIKNLSGQVQRNHRELKSEIDAVAPANNLVIINQSLHIDFRVYDRNLDKRRNSLF